jgi:hypothetical protein
VSTIPSMTVVDLLELDGLEPDELELEDAEDWGVAPPGPMCKCASGRSSARVASAVSAAPIDGLEPMTVATPRQRQLIVQMERVGRAAALARSWRHCMRLLAELIPLAQKLAGRWSVVVTRNSRALLEGIWALARALRSYGRPTLIRAVPSILRETIAVLVRRRLQGRPLPPSMARRLFARLARAMLADIPIGHSVSPRPYLDERAPYGARRFSQPRADSFAGDLYDSGLDAFDQTDCPSTADPCRGTGMLVSCFRRSGRRCGRFLQLVPDLSGGLSRFEERDCCEDWPPPPPPPPSCSSWVPATTGDVVADQTQSRYRALLGSPVGTQVEEVHNGRNWRFRVVGRATDPDLTTFAKDVRGWICV